MLNTLTRQLDAGTELTDEQVRDAISCLTDETVTPEAKASFLTALATKGETPAEIAAFASELRDKALPVPLDDETRGREMLDVCGTGGDKLGTFNISTTVALVAAAAGVTVAKHGNRAITSKSGSADVLAELGIPTDLTPEQVAASLRDHGFAFLFAPAIIRRSGTSCLHASCVPIVASGRYSTFSARCSTRLDRRHNSSAYPRANCASRSRACYSRSASGAAWL